MAKITMNVRTKQTLIFKFMMFAIPLLGRIKLIDLETAAKSVAWLASKGALSKIKIGNDKWKRIKFDLEYEIYEVNE